MGRNYELRKGTKNFLNTQENPEFEDHNVNLKDYQWELVDEIAEEREVSRNQVFRNILDQYFSSDNE